MQNKIKRYLISSAITFLTAALLAFLSAMLGAIDAGASIDGALFFSLATGAFTAGLRALIKYLYEVLASMPKPVASRVGVTDRDKKAGKSGKLYQEYLSMLKTWKGATWSNFARRTLRKRRTKK